LQNKKTTETADIYPGAVILQENGGTIIIVLSIVTPVDVLITINKKPPHFIRVVSYLLKLKK